ncbi:OmpA family protein [Desertivirga xinjiangensis]|uniref:OmpA family protein n=1 Tax=Desertivirga xinjiangensis TaxID=539206 RepID=UPI00210995DD|nr:OmpA family protein [Pedobacter xinjiangensis]
MKFICSLFLCVLSLFATAQQNIRSANRGAQRHYDDANQLLTYNQYEKAIEELKIAVSIDKQFLAAYQQLGDIYRRLQQYPLAKSNYLRVLEINPDFHPGTYFGLAESELYSAEYEEALAHFRKYASFSNLPESSKKITSKYIADCEFSLEAIKKPISFKPQNLKEGINTAADEYLPVVTADEETIIFTRRANNNEDFYQSQKTNAAWSLSKGLGPNINTTTFNEGAQCISPDGMYLFFTGCNRPDGLGRCDIYVCKREGGEWSKPFNLGPPINTSGWESQPSISADGRTLYFVSARAGGIGGNDIWKTTLLGNGEWTSPVNLGPNINTPYDEHSPFIHHDGKTLYFASNGWPGFGKNDLFISRRDESGKWLSPLNLGYPLNNAGEQSGLTISSDGHTAYFASNIQGGLGNMDIYSFELPKALRPGLVTYVKGKVFDAHTKELLEATVKISELKQDSLIFDDLSDITNGQFLATMPAGNKYALSVEKSGYLFYSENFSLLQMTANKPYLLDIPLQKIEAGRMVVLNNIFFDTNKATILEESKTELNHLIRFLNNNPTLSIEISGHTDNTGDDKANQLLSENRAKAVQSYLISNKIPASRLSYKGLGKNAPIADNTTSEGRQKNRRTEFRIIKLD